MMGDLISEWRNKAVGIDPETVVESEKELGNIRSEVIQLSEEQKKNFLYKLLAETHGRGNGKTRDEMTSVVCSAIKILRHYEKLKEQRSKFSVGES